MSGTQLVVRLPETVTEIRNITDEAYPVQATVWRSERKAIEIRNHSLLESRSIAVGN